VLEESDDTIRLLRLFRHTSFVWRIRGDEEKEGHYLKRIDENKVKKQEVGAEKLDTEVNYFWRRLKAIFRVALRGTVASQ
jgi:hypothetical protein